MRLSLQADVWALGVTLFHLVTTQLPFDKPVGYTADVEAGFIGYQVNHSGVDFPDDMYIDEQLKSFILVHTPLFVRATWCLFQTYHSIKCCSVSSCPIIPCVASFISFSHQGRHDKASRRSNDEAY